jgi:hypothetical protein
VRHIADGLDDFFEAFVFYLVEQKRKKNRQRKAEDQIVGIEQQHVADQPPGKDRAEKLIKPFQANPGTAPDALAGGIAFKGDLQAIERDEVKDDIIGDRQRNQKQQVFVPWTFLISR